MAHLTNQNGKFIQSEQLKAFLIDSDKDCQFVKEIHYRPKSTACFGRFYVFIILMFNKEEPSVNDNAMSTLLKKTGTKSDSYRKLIEIP
jgi:hypothetical protein